MKISVSIFPTIYARDELDKGFCCCDFVAVTHNYAFCVRRKGNARNGVYCIIKKINSSNTAIKSQLVSIRFLSDRSVIKKYLPLLITNYDMHNIYNFNSVHELTIANQFTYNRRFVINDFFL